MPKAKPKADNIHLFRLELQQTERDALEAALAGRFVTNAVSATGNVLTGIGNALSPFSGAIQAFAVAWIAEKSVDEILDAAKNAGARQKVSNEESYHAGGQVHIQYFSAWLSSQFENGGWEAVCSPKSRSNLAINRFQNLTTRAMQGPNWFFDIFLKFLDTICAQSDGMKATQNPVDLWAEWYSVEQYGKDAYYYDTNGSAGKGLWKTIFG